MAHSKSFVNNEEHLRVPLAGELNQGQVNLRGQEGHEDGGFLSMFSSTHFMRSLLVILIILVMTLVWIFAIVLHSAHEIHNRLTLLETNSGELMSKTGELQTEQILMSIKVKENEVALKIPQETRLLNELTEIGGDVKTLQLAMITLTQNPVPIGFIYTQLPGQFEPVKIWEHCLVCKWVEVSSTYAGLFFRVLGGGSGHFGETQEENAPRIIHAETQAISYWPAKGNILLPVGGTSAFIYSGKTVNFGSIEATRYTTSGGEVRPINQAIRIWKRVA